ncbi:hypothetical protein F5Y17DRAFT_102783 [Xylariaceae sp. FL0594]|nr:hypothetical protein F5Y17DRAFT_102783 [Xylariaceae sp. FL0594]
MSNSTLRLTCGCNMSTDTSLGSYFACHPSHHPTVESFRISAWSFLACCITSLLLNIILLPWWGPTFFPLLLLYLVCCCCSAIPEAARTLLMPQVSHMSTHTIPGPVFVPSRLFIVLYLLCPSPFQRLRSALSTPWAQLVLCTRLSASAMMSKSHCSVAQYCIGAIFPCLSWRCSRLVRTRDRECLCRMS